MTLLFWVKWDKHRGSILVSGPDEEDIGRGRRCCHAYLRTTCLNSPSYISVAFERQDNGEPAAGYPVELETILQSTRRGRYRRSPLHTTEHTFFMLCAHLNKLSPGSTKGSRIQGGLVWSMLYLQSPVRVCC